MKTASIISVGSELMKGKMDDTNSTYISRWLNELGIQVKLRLSIEDIEEEIINALNISNKCNIIILTGGLGPTDDDITRETVSKFLNKKLIFNEEAWESIKKFFLKRFNTVPVSNKKQAYQIEDSQILPNKLGTAPGIFYNDNNHTIVLLPGPPNENQFLIKNHVYKLFQKNNIIMGNIYTEIIRLYNIGESELADLLQDYKTECEIGYYFSQEGWVEIHITYRGFDINQNQIKVNESLNYIKRLLDKKNVFYTENKDLSLILLERLIINRQTIAFAESVTGGNISSEFVKNPDASKCFYGSVVTYSNESKMELLNVKKVTLEKYGAVSKETVEEMILGLNKIFNADIEISISGIAGPSGGNDEKPVGLVWFGFKINQKIFTKKEIFFGNRNRIIKRATNYVFIEILKNGEL